MKFTRKKIWDYFFNALLVGIVVILLVPSWRISFQGWFQSLFMGEVEFAESDRKPIPPASRNWILFDMNDQLINFNDFTGKPIVLSFWATWCPPCRAELPDLLELKTEMAAEIHVLAVSEESTEIIRESGLPDSYPFLYSTIGIPAFFGVDAYPTLCIISSKMELVFKSTGTGSINTEENRLFLKKLSTES